MLAAQGFQESGPPTRRNFRYNGEEVHLHWANADQYYIKTSEHFTDYRWKAPGALGDEGFTILFKLRNAEQEAGNNKAGEKRYFVFLTDLLSISDSDCSDTSELSDGPTCRPAKSGDMSPHSVRTVTIPVQYRALTPAETKLYAGNGDKPQQTLNDSALAAVRGHAILAANPALKAAVLAPARNSAGQAMIDSQSKEPVPLLLKHLRTYVKRNNSDFFIHKDLAGFLTRELDFYLKNEVLSLDTLLAGGPRPSEGWFQLLHVIKTLGSDIITFLAQLENFQKTLFEKKKFVTDCHWCLTLDRVAASLLPEVAANAKQWDQWEDLHGISKIEPKSKTWAKGTDPAKALAWLKTMPFLMVDTSLFKDTDFQDRLLATLPDIDGQLDGLLVNSENFQGLRLLAERYESSVKCAYIDPPYNTGGDGFIYKDAFRHSAWLAMLVDRIMVATKILTKTGNILISCDDNEQHRLRLALDLCHDSENFRSNLVWKSRQNVDSRAIDNISNDHEFILAYGNAFRGADKDLDKYSNLDGDERGKWMSDNMVGLATRDLRPNLHFHIAVTTLGNLRKFATSFLIPASALNVSEMQAFSKGDRKASVFMCLTCERDRVLSFGEIPEPLDGRVVLEGLYECPANGWCHDPASMAIKIRENRVLWPSSPTGRPRKKTFFNELKSDFTGFSSVVGFTRDGTSDLTDCFGYTPVSFPKPVKLIEKVVLQCAAADSTICDFFAGSGTTGHAVMNLNRDDGGKRRFILVEMGVHFDSVIKKRIQKVVFSECWKEGVPIENPDVLFIKNPYHGVSHAFKVIRLESYEDALANIEFTHPAESELFSRRVGEEYLLKYALEFETQGSATRLRPEALTSPFDYRLNLFDGTETRSKPVDLPETFHYLIGLKVATRRWIERKEGKLTDRYLHVTGTANGDGRRVAILWRTVPSGWKEADYQAEKEWALEMRVFDGADRGWYNGPGTFPDAQPLDGEFRRLLFA